jgi:hypothetical protein
VRCKDPGQPGASDGNFDGCFVIQIFDNSRSQLPIPAGCYE